MNTEAVANRAETVSKLWEFKSLAARHATRGMPMVHFSMLLEDPRYRQSVLQQALSIEDTALRRVATELQSMNLSGPLRQQAMANGSATLAAGGPGSITLPMGGGGGGSADSETPDEFLGARQRYAIVAGMVALLLAVALWTYWQGQPRVHEVAGDILQNTTWSRGDTYLLKGMTFVAAGARLTIEPGVTVRGESGSALVVTRDARIHARGTPGAPIVFTSARPVGQRQPGDWGGLVLLGNAPTNRDFAHIEGIDESDTRGDFGGSDTESSCGVLEYLRVEFAGFEIAKDKELNGLTLGGCGRGTIVRHVQVHQGLDDGIEVFGGTVDLRNIVITAPGDDAFDWDMGWRGRVQFLAVLMHPTRGDNAFEGDSNKRDMNSQPRSAPEFYNVTLLADPAGEARHRAMTIRRGSGGHFHNFLLSGFNAELVDLRDAPTAMLIRDGELAFDKLLVHQSGPDGINPFPAESKDDDGGFSEARYFASRMVLLDHAGLKPGARNLRSASFAIDTPADHPRLVAKALPQDEFWDEGANFHGAIRPDGGQDWTRPWAAYPEN